MSKRVLFVVGVVLAILGLVMMFDPRISAAAAICVTLGGFFTAFFSSGVVTVEISETPEPYMPEIRNIDREMIVESLRELALECEYEEPEVGILRRDSQSRYFHALAERVEKGL